MLGRWTSLQLGLCQGVVESRFWGTRLVRPIGVLEKKSGVMDCKSYRFGCVRWWWWERRGWRRMEDLYYSLVVTSLAIYWWLSQMQAAMGSESLENRRGGLLKKTEPTEFEEWRQVDLHASSLSRFHTQQRDFPISQHAYVLHCTSQLTDQDSAIKRRRGIIIERRETVEGDGVGRSV